jgi:hypothetical protein
MEGYHAGGLRPGCHGPLGLKIACDELTSAGKYTAGNTVEAMPWLKYGAKIGLGTNDLSQVSLVEEKVA